eukprot:TRINITY_DN46128_c0_g1_i1.p1 TRINITY_DN46128_c0_g1~~TRINITY_DN46128_c0_g1_i1.p1  ORF type:complete len:386 (+),score=59.47 TRINITY_DN46128_c0_g1_i1:42-1199(+)
MDTVPTFPAIPADAAKDFEGKVIIIGAGVTGLFAANALKYMGIEDFVVLEAGSTFGGRCKASIDFHSDVPLDLGAEWIHAPNEQVVKDMLVFPAEEALDPSEFIKYQPRWFFRSSRSRLAEYFYQETKWKRSSWWHFLEQHVYRHVEQKVQFNTIVTNISYNQVDGQASVVTANGAELRADKVICTVPLAVLKKEGALKFEPPLPEQMCQAIQAVNMPGGFRILFQMKEKFYPDLTADSSRWELIRDHDNLFFIYDALLGKELSGAQNVLAYVAVGDKYVGELGKQGDEDLAKAALATIDRLFDGQGTKNYMKHEVQNWTSEPHILGAYSFPCALRHRKELGKTLNDKLLFAGEHTSVKYHGLVPGAALEGRRVAVEAVSGRVIS